MRLILLALLAVPLFGKCETAFHVAREGDGALAWGETTEDMREWWSKEGKKKHPTLCYEAEPENADYVIVWRDETWQRRIVVPDFSSTRTTGSIGKTPVNVNSTTQGSRTTTANTWTIHVTVYDKAGKALYQGENTGRFRWSKPDEDALEGAVKQMAKGFENVEPKNQTGLE